METVMYLLDDVIFTTRKRCDRKVVFLVVCVCQSVCPQGEVPM